MNSIVTKFKLYFVKMPIGSNKKENHPEGGSAMAATRPRHSQHASHLWREVASTSRDIASGVGPVCGGPPYKKSVIKAMTRSCSSCCSPVHTRSVSGIFVALET